MKTAIRIVCFVLTFCSALILGGIGYWHHSLPNQFLLEENDTLSVSKTVNIGSSHTNLGVRCHTVNAAVGETYTTTVKWLGLFPVKDVSVTVVDPSQVVLGGIPFGVKLYTEGVMVVSLSAVDGAVSPARIAGLKVGDLILSINGDSVYTNEDVSETVKRSAGKPMVFRIKRDGIESDVRITAVKSQNEGCYKAGIWVRDSSAGVGTLTFYDPSTKLLAGLGHAVCDVDTGDIIPISGGELVPARIYSVTKSQNGMPGELRGGFLSGSYGKLLANGNTGVYAASSGMVGKCVNIKLKQEIREGDAEIYTTVNGTTPQWYTVRIIQVRYHDANATRNMVIEITDPRLLEATGGIVQGMSGSPIVQDGKLVGAITHVFINDPTRGYAIFAENMLETAQSIVDSELKEAS